VLEFLTKNQATPLDAQKTLDAAIAQAAKDHKRVFLHFGAPWCGWCHRLEDLDGEARNRSDAREGLRRLEDRLGLVTSAGRRC
jgi:thiol:disulfide interchange protein